MSGPEPRDHHLLLIVHDQPSRPNSIVRIHHELVTAQAPASPSIYLGEIQTKIRFPIGRLGLEHPPNDTPREEP